MPQFSGHMYHTFLIKKYKMILVGAGGHASELVKFLTQKIDCVYTNDNDIPYSEFSNMVHVTNKNQDQINDFLNRDNRFILALGNPANRKKMTKYFELLGGNVVSVISPNCTIHSSIENWGKGLNIMEYCFISTNVSIGKATLVNCKSSIHHDVTIGDYSEISPCSTILGSAKIGNETFIGAGSIILPGIEIGDNVIIGAGSVVTKNIDSGEKIMGIPAN